MTYRLTLIVSAALCALPISAEAQTGLRLRGHFVWGPEVSSLRPCNTGAAYWLAISPELRADLIDPYMRLRAEPYARVYVELAAWTDPGPTVGFAEEYDATWWLSRVDVIRPATADDCEGTPLPAWLDPESPDCDDSNTTLAMNNCLSAELVSADLRLAQYATEALRFSPDSDGFLRAQRLWQADRDGQCDEAAQGGGTSASIRLLGCRITWSERRLLAIWTEFLENSTTELRNPGDVGGR